MTHQPEREKVRSAAHDDYMRERCDARLDDSGRDVLVPAQVRRRLASKRGECDGVRVVSLNLVGSSCTRVSVVRTSTRGCAQDDVLLRDEASTPNFMKW
jgi:hypothetical protein